MTKKIRNESSKVFLHLLTVLMRIKNYWRNVINQAFQWKSPYALQRKRAVSFFMYLIHFHQHPT